MKRILILTALTVSSLPFMLSAQHLKVLTYNIHHAENMNGETDLQSIANVILATNPDLVALQEVDSVTGRTNGVDQLKELASLTGMYTYFAKAMNYDGGGYGTGILSRLPITAKERIALPGTAGREPRVAGVATIKLPGDSMLQFVSAHLDAGKDPADRVSQATALVKHFTDAKTPVILAGDLNAPPAAKEITILKELFADATQGTGPTCPSDTPTVKLDYILLYPKQHWEVVEPRVIAETVASDHRPVVCELRIKHTTSDE
ncbi:endonuclease/exonuclease/phosphatase family protein [Chitinophaga japonensis]|uniref:Endonuclease/exonuclease/phosphatase family metal-dependent hydrolase n=1 Tax=Chitinophaga japonensis TaxID=104662 RepID=A0A562SLS2_CHIJA|nr:endonuclease/exonuclease/phosphatase family protein [Chitinophaga japonensis]TWI82108.1 endonuclease/exonuclease/phosphatase family metal-dependent hydrolase [Chitinophaga japonensis]